MTTSFKLEASENTRQSIYTCIRYASKLIKLRTDLRKSHPATFREKVAVAPLEDDETTLYDDKDEKRMTWLRNESQLIFPSRFPVNQVPEITKEEDEEDDESSSNFDPEDNIDDSEPESELDIARKAAYATAWRKLAGETLPNEEPKTNTAVLISLSPGTLAAANAARLRRKRVHHQH